MDAVQENVPPPVSLSDRLRGLEEGQSILITDSPPESVRAILSRIVTRKGYRLRKHKTHKEGDAIRVWRLK
jgi:TusA-related sulfurtransferase